MTKLKLKDQGSHNDTARAQRQVDAFSNVVVKFFLPVRVGYRSDSLSAKSGHHLFKILCVYVASAFYHLSSFLKMHVFTKSHY
jgi:hypothetical protein